MKQQISPLSFELILLKVRALDIQPMGLYHKEPMLMQMLPQSSENGSLCLISTLHVSKSPNHIESFTFALEDGDVPKPFMKFQLNYSYDDEDNLVFQHVDEILWLGQCCGVLSKINFYYKYEDDLIEQDILYKKIKNDTNLYLKLREDIKKKMLWKISL